MRFLPFILILAFASCRTEKKQAAQPFLATPVSQVPEIVYIHDTLYIGTSQSCKPQIDSLKSKLFVASYKIERVRFYLHICQRNKTQDKFLKGWIARVVE